MLALWQQIRTTPNAYEVLAAIVLAVPTARSYRRPTPASPSRARWSRQAPIVPTSEQAVVASNRQATIGTGNVQAILPGAGRAHARLPDPAHRPRHGPAAETDAVRAVIDELTSSEARSTLLAAGFRDPAGTAPIGSGIRQEKVRVLPEPGAKDVGDLTRELDSISTPSHLLLVFDVSLSMTDPADRRLRRVDLVAGAAQVATDLLPDTSSIGLWAFSAKMNGKPGLGPDVADAAARPDPAQRGEPPQRTPAPRGPDTDLPARRRHGAVRDHRGRARLHGQDLRPARRHSVVILTDGQNDINWRTDPGPARGPHRRSQRAGGKKVAIYTAGSAPTTDYQALSAISKASGAASTRINSVQDARVPRCSTSKGSISAGDPKRSGNRLPVLRLGHGCCVAAICRPRSTAFVSSACPVQGVSRTRERGPGGGWRRRPAPDARRPGWSPGRSRGR